VKNTNGFTLLELLVVVSIISMLSSVVLASVNKARSKAKDIKTIAEMMRFRTDAELISGEVGGVYWMYSESPYFYWHICNASNYGLPQDNRGGPYEDLLLGNLTLYQIDEYQDFVVQGDPQTGQFNRISCHDEKIDSYVLQVPLTNSTPSKPRFWCIDSAGASHFTPTPLAPYQYECPAS
jgi:prepilin-type N-terminal cleavage/methylation domain-containing protein